MELSNEDKIKYMKRLLKSRMRILVNNGFYGLLLMHMIYTLDEKCETAATDGKRIYFSPAFLDELSDSELDFIMMHEILHVVLQHCMRQGDREDEIFNIACDIVVNSNILYSQNMEKQAITFSKYGESMHTAPNGVEGYEYTAEQIYEMMQCMVIPKSKDKKSGRGKGKNAWDNHTRWGKGEKGENDENDTGNTEGEDLKNIWIKRVLDAYQTIEIRKANNQRGVIPHCAERLIKQLRKSQTDWRRILNEFVQEEIVDYSFLPPDRRFNDNDFFLPDFNEKDDCPEDVLFMIDTSASMSDEMITAAYLEVKGAVEQYDGRLKGWLGFFDGDITEPIRFENEDEFKIIKPKGGGGTEFRVIFEYVLTNMMDNPPVCIIILTDGYAPFYNESIAMGIPVLWLLNNENVIPPWGKVARIKI